MRPHSLLSASPGCTSIAGSLLHPPGEEEALQGQRLRSLGFFFFFLLLVLGIYWVPNKCSCKKGTTSRQVTKTRKWLKARGLNGDGHLLPAFLSSRRGCRLPEAWEGPGGRVANPEEGPQWPQGSIECGCLSGGHHLRTLGLALARTAWWKGSPGSYHLKMVGARPLL